MFIYKYGLGKDNVIYISQCEVLNEDTSKHGEKYFNVQENKYPKKYSVYEKDLEVFGNKVMYSLSPDKKKDFLNKIKEASELTIKTYLEKANKTKELLNTIIILNEEV